MREQSGLLENEPGAPGEIVDGRRAPERGELLAGDLVAELGLVTEGEQRLATARRRSRTRDLEHLLLGHEGPLATPWWPRKRAVAADVAAERRQRDEDLRGVRDDGRASTGSCLLEEVVERDVEELESGIAHR